MHITAVDTHCFNALLKRARHVGEWGGAWALHGVSKHTGARMPPGRALRKHRHVRTRRRTYLGGRAESVQPTCRIDARYNNVACRPYTTLSGCALAVGSLAHGPLKVAAWVACLPTNCEPLSTRRAHAWNAHEVFILKLLETIELGTPRMHAACRGL